MDKQIYTISLIKYKLWHKYKLFSQINDLYTPRTFSNYLKKTLNDARQVYESNKKPDGTMCQNNSETSEILFETFSKVFSLDHSQSSLPACTSPQKY